MIKLKGDTVYLSTLERVDCKTIFNDFEYDFNSKAEQLHIGYSIEKADEWFEEIQKNQEKKHIRLGIFLNNGDVIGDVALQDINYINRTASIGMGMAKICNRNKGYGKEALNLIMDYGFNQVGLERITAKTLEINIPARKSLENQGFTLEGTERKEIYFGGKRYDRYCYSILREEYCK